MPILRPTLRRIPQAALIASVAACGGGGGSSDSPFVPASPAATAEGLYTVLSLTNRVAKWLVLDDGGYYLFYSAVGKPNEFAGVVQGSATSTSSTLSSSNARDFNFEGQGFRSTTVSADYVSRKTINGATTLAGTATTLSGSYDVAYESTATLAALAGSYVGAVSAAAGVQPGALTINANGSVAGVWFGCVVTGTATPRTKGNAYDLGLSFGTLVACTYSGLSLKGIAFVDVGAKRLYAAAPNDARTDGLLFVGLRP